MTTEEFRSSPPIPNNLPTTPAVAAHRQETIDTVQRIMGEDIGSRQSLDHRADVAPSYGTPTDDASTTQVAKDQAAQVADTVKQAGGQVAGTVQEQAGQVRAEAGHQAKKLLSQTQSEVTEQAAATQQRVAEGLHSLADELAGMAGKSDQDGLATDLARQAADKARQAAGWLADRDPGTLLDEVRSFARRKPGTYLAIALGAGVLSGRLARGLTAPAVETSSPANPVAAGRPAAAGYGVTRNGGERNGEFSVHAVLPSTGGPTTTMPTTTMPTTTVPTTTVPRPTGDIADAYRGDVAP